MHLLSVSRRSRRAGVEEEEEEEEEGEEGSARCEVEQCLPPAVAGSQWVPRVVVVVQFVHRSEVPV